MATFKVGQRVKVVYILEDAPWCRANLLGRETTILAQLADDLWEVDLPGFSESRARLNGSRLAPLTDPGADAFLESIRKLKPLHEEPTVKVPQLDEHSIAMRDLLDRLPFGPKLATPSGD